MASAEEEAYVRGVYPLLIRIARRFHPPRRQDVDDLAQIGAIGALRAYRKHGAPPHISVVGVAARREMLDYIRHVTKKKRQCQDGPIVALTDDLAAITPSYQARPEDALIRHIDLERALDLLTPKEREILRDLLIGRTLREVGDVHGVTESRISQIKSEAVRRIRSETAFPKAA